MPAGNTPGGTGHPQQVDTAERRAYTLNLRKTGADYRTIAAAVIERFKLENLPNGYDCRYAYKDVKRELEKLYREMADDTEEIRQLQVERLNRLLLAIWERALQGDLGAVDRALKLVAQLCQLQGANMPDKVDMTTDGQPITFHVVREEPKDADA